MISLILKYAKAVIAAGGVFVAALGTANSDGVVTSTDWVWIIGTTIIGSGLVAFTPNKQA